MHAQFLFLGTGGSLGIPVISCHCRVCRSLSPLNKRFRPSGLLTIGNKRFLIDAGPDFRLQALKFGIQHLDGVLLTHMHYDHIGGLDELRIFYIMHHKKLACLSSKETFDELHHRFHYLFRKGGENCPQLDFTVLEEDFGRIEFQGIPIDYLSYYQAGMKVTGYRVGPFAYISDIRKYDISIVDLLKGVDILVLSALRYTASEVHFSIEEAIEFSRDVGARHTFLMHIAHDIEHEETNAKLPDGILLSHDGLEIVFDV